jgi:hypothetical protein
VRLALMICSAEGVALTAEWIRFDGESRRQSPDTSGQLPPGRRRYSQLPPGRRRYKRKAALAGRFSEAEKR